MLAEKNIDALYGRICMYGGIFNSRTPANFGKLILR